MRFQRTIISLMCALCMLFISVSVFAQSDTAGQEVDIVIDSQQGLTLDIQFVEFRLSTGHLEAEDEVFVILHGDLVNTSNGSECVRARRVRLILDDEEYAPQAPLMDAVQADLEEAIDFIGPVLGQCVDGNSRARTFVAFEAPFGVSDAALTFWDQEEAFEIIWPESEDDLAHDSIATTNASATPTRFTNSTPASVTYGSVINSNVNVRSCASTNCQVLEVVSPDEEVIVLELENGWYAIEMDNGTLGYVHSDLLVVREGGSRQRVSPTPSRNSASTPSATPSPEAPLEFDDDLVLMLIELTAINQGLEVDSIRLQNGKLVIDAPASSSDYESPGEYRILYIGTMTGATVGAYRQENTVATPPREIEFNFKSGSIVLMRVTLNYSDALDFIEGRITAEQFLVRWEIE